MMSLSAITAIVRLALIIIKTVHNVIVLAQKDWPLLGRARRFVWPPADIPPRTPPQAQVDPVVAVATAELRAESRLREEMALLREDSRTAGAAMQREIHALKEQLAAMKDLASEPRNGDSGETTLPSGRAPLVAQGPPSDQSGPVTGRSGASRTCDQPTASSRARTRSSLPRHISRP